MKQFLLAVACAIVGLGSAEAQVVFSTNNSSGIVVDRAGNSALVLAQVTKTTTNNDITWMSTSAAPAGCSASAPFLHDYGQGVVGIVLITCTSAATPGYYSFNASALGLVYSTAPPTQVSGSMSWWLQVTN